MEKKKISHKNPNVILRQYNRKNKPHRICHFEKIYGTLGKTIESDVFKIYDREDDRGPRNRDPKNPTATDREPRPRYYL